MRACFQVKKIRSTSIVCFEKLNSKQNIGCKFWLQDLTENDIDTKKRVIFGEFVHLYVLFKFPKAQQLI